MLCDILDTAVQTCALSPVTLKLKASIFLEVRWNVMIFSAYLYQMKLLYVRVRKQCIYVIYLQRSMYLVEAL